MALWCPEHEWIFLGLGNDETPACLRQQHIRVIVIVDEEGVAGSVFVIGTPEIESEWLPLSQFMHLRDEVILKLDAFHLIPSLRLW